MLQNGSSLVKFQIEFVSCLPRAKALTGLILLSDRDYHSILPLVPWHIQQVVDQPHVFRCAPIAVAEVIVLDWCGITLTVRVKG